MNAPHDFASIADGVYYGLDAAAYHAAERLSSHGARAILRSPLHFRTSREIQKEPTAAMLLGSAVHFGCLQPELFDGNVACAPDCDKRSAAGKAAWLAFTEQNAGRIVLSLDDYGRARRCIDAVHAHPAARQLIEGAKTEVSLFWTDRQFSVPCKARLDAYALGGVVDVKTCQDASPDAFARAIGSFGYHLQAAAYFSGAEHALNATPEFFVFVCVETDEPFAVACYALERQSILAGANLWDAALARYQTALAAGAWDGYPTVIQPINAPRWALRDFY